MRRLTTISVSTTLFVSLIVGLLYFVYKKPNPETLSANVKISEASDVLATTSAITIATDSREYKSSLYDFSLHYPDELTVSEFNEGGGSRTITFANAETGYSFQIFITPYYQDVVTPERFNLDVPSGVFEEPLTVLIDGIPATAFFSSNPIMGETREVWIIHGGYLYEVTTYKELDNWLAKIMQTWKFLE